MTRTFQSSLFGLVLALPLTLWAADAAWDKKPADWSDEDVHLILTDSPWVPTMLVVQASEHEHYPRTHPLAEANRQRGTISNKMQVVQWWHEIPDGPPVVWWSSRTVRMAELRLRQLRGRAPANAPLEAPPLDHVVIAIRGDDAVRILRDAREDLRDTVYLELPSGLPLDLASFQFVEDASGHYAAFYFPRSIEGQPTVRPETQLVFFRCRATAKTERIGAQNSLDIRARFAPRKMRAAGQPDF